MALYTKLFRIVIANSYYKSANIGNDFDIEPTPSTGSWMVQRKVRMLRHSDGIELIWFSENYDNPLALFKKKVEGVTISFIMSLKNSQALNRLELETGYPTGQVYYLHNRHDNNSNHLLHSKAFMGAADLVKISAVDHYPTHPGWDVFAMIDINLDLWLAKLSNPANNQLAAYSTYKIRIQNRSTFWRYYLIDTAKRLQGTLSILSKGDPSYFGEVKASTEFPNTYCAESTMPMALCDQYDHYFSLSEIDKSGEKNTKILLEMLPYPTHDSLKKDKSNKKKLYSDIVVYV
ncbi:hypothetical protein [Candidatus Cardinium hertigii]|nr:hypothetical protein [Candidatus Cardinium hertigii]